MVYLELNLVDYGKSKMYYIEKEIKVSRGLYSHIGRFHVVTSYQVDLLNREVALSIASYESKEAFAKAFFNRDTSGQVTFNQVGSSYDKMNFSIDHCLFALRLACSDVNSNFHGCEIKKIYDLSEFRDKFLQLPDDLTGQYHSDYSNHPIDFNQPTGEHYEYIETGWDNKLNGEFVISDVLVGNVVSE